MIIRNSKDVHFVSTRFMDVKNKLLHKRSYCESKFMSLLLDAGFYFSREKCDYKIGNRWSYYDFYIPALNLYIEIDGKEHLLPEHIEIDNQKAHQVVVYGNKLIRYTNKEVVNMYEASFDDFLLRVYNRTNKHKKTLNSFKRNIIHKAAIEWALTNRVFGEGISMQPYYLYNTELGAIYCFKNLGDLRLATGMSIKATRMLLSRANNNRALKYIVSTSLTDCQQKIQSRFGLSIDRIIEWKLPVFVIEGNSKQFTSQHMFDRVVEDEILRHENFEAYVQNKIKYYAKKDPHVIIIPNYEKKTISVTKRIT